MFLVSVEGLVLKFEFDADQWQKAKKTCSDTQKRYSDEMCH